MNNRRQLPKGIRLFYGLLAILIVPLVPFVALGWLIEPQVEHGLAAARHWPTLVAVIGALALISDIFLPIPSSFVCTTLGQILGILPATLISTLGFQCGSWLGWGVGRKWGGLWIENCCGTETLTMGKAILDRWGVWAIALTRPIPLVAEAVVLLLGTHPDRFSKWFPALLLSNFSVALAWSSLGHWSQAEQRVAFASILSVLIPALAIAMLQLWRSKTRDRLTT